MSALTSLRICFVDFIFLLVAVACCIGDVVRVRERVHQCKLFLHEMCKIVSKCLHLQRFARYLFHAICGP